MQTSSPEKATRRAPGCDRLLLAMIALVLLTAALRLPLLDVPLERDEGEYAYIASRLSHNELPYRDWVDQKPPAVFWVYRAALMLPLPHVRAIHVMGLAFWAATSCALFLLGRLLTSYAWAFFGAVLFSVLSADPHIQANAANTETFMLLPLVLAQWTFLYCGVENRRRLLWMFACGLLIGVATAFKQVAAGTWPLMVLIYPLFFAGEKRLRRALVFAVMSGFGIVVVWGVIGSYFHFRGGLKDLIYNVVTHNLEYINAVPWKFRFKLCQQTLNGLSKIQWLAWMLALVGLASVWRAGRYGVLLVFTEWVLASVAGLSASGYFFPHYFQQALPVLCLLAALGAEAISRADVWGKAPGGARLAIIGGFACAVPLFFIVPFWMNTPREMVQRIYPGNYFGEMQDFGTRLSEVTGPRDKVYIFGAEPEILFYAGRVSATRYIFLFPLYGPYSDVREKQMATAAEISSNAPAALLYLPNSLFRKGTEQFLSDWTEKELLEHFTGDLWLAVDREMKGHLFSGKGTNPPPETAGMRVRGGLFLRKPPVTETNAAPVGAEGPKGISR